MSVFNQLNTPAASSQDMLASTLAGLKTAELLEQQSISSRITSDYYQYFGGGDLSDAHLAGSGNMQLEPSNIGDKLFGTAEDKKDNETARLFLDDPYTGQAGSDHFVSSNYEDVGHFMTLLGATGSAMYTLLGNSAFGVQYYYTMKDVTGELLQSEGTSSIGMYTGVGGDRDSTFGGGTPTTSKTKHTNADIAFTMAMRNEMVAVSNMTKDVKTATKGALGIATPVVGGIAIAAAGWVKSAFEGEDYDPSAAMAAGLYQAANSIFTQAAAEAIGYTSTNVVKKQIYGSIVSAIVTELFEYATGYDRSLGWGGEFAGFDNNGNAMYEQSKGITDMMNELDRGITEIANSIFGPKYTYNAYATDFTDYDGNYVGSRSTYQDPYGNTQTAQGWDNGNEFEYTTTDVYGNKTTTYGDFTDGKYETSSVTKNTDGSTTYRDSVSGETTTVNRDGTIQHTNATGAVTTYTKNGSLVSTSYTARDDDDDDDDDDSSGDTGDEDSSDNDDNSHTGTTESADGHGE